MWSALAAGAAPPLRPGLPRHPAARSLPPPLRARTGDDPEGNEFPALLPPHRHGGLLAERKGNFIGRAALHRQFEVDHPGTRAATTTAPRCCRGAPGAWPCWPPASPAGGGLRGRAQGGLRHQRHRRPLLEVLGAGGDRMPADEHDRRSIALACLDAPLLVGDRWRSTCAAAAPRRVVAFHGRSEAPPYFRAAPMSPARGAGPGARRRPPGRARGAAAAGPGQPRVAPGRLHQPDPVGDDPLAPGAPAPGVRPGGPLRRAPRTARPSARRSSTTRAPTSSMGRGRDRRRDERLPGVPADRVAPGQRADGQHDGVQRHRRLAQPGRPPARAAAHPPGDEQPHRQGRAPAAPSPWGRSATTSPATPATERPAVVNFPVEADNPYRIDVAAAPGCWRRQPGDHHLRQEHGPAPRTGRRDTGDGGGAGGPAADHVRHGPRPRPGRPALPGALPDGADIVTGSTHKTFFGTQRGIVGGDITEDPRADLWKAVRRRAFPGCVSNHHLGTMVGLLLAAIEMNTFKAEYQPQVIANAKAFARALADAGLARGGRPGGGLHRDPPGDRPRWATPAAPKWPAPWRSATSSATTRRSPATRASPPLRRCAWASPR